MSDLYRLRATRGWKDDEYIDQLRNSGVLIPVTKNYKASLEKLMAWDAYRDGRRRWPFGDDLVRVGEVPAVHAIVDAAIGDAL